MSQFGVVGPWFPVAALRARDWLQQQQTNAWFRVVYDRDGWPVLRSRSQRVDSGLVISSDPNVGGFIAAPFERLDRTVTPAPLRRITTYVQQAGQTGLTAGLTLLVWGPLLLTDYRSDDAQNPYEQPTTHPATGLVGGDPQTFSQIVNLWTAAVPASIQDLDPVFVEIQQRADTHWLQQTLGDHHRLELQIDSAVALAECGMEVYVYWPEKDVVGYYQIVKMSQPLSAEVQLWSLQYISRGVS